MFSVSNYLAINLTKPFGALTKSNQENKAAKENWS